MKKKHPLPIREIGRCDVKVEPYEKRIIKRIWLTYEEDYKLRYMDHHTLHILVCEIFTCITAFTNDEYIASPHFPNNFPRR